MRILMSLTVVAAAALGLSSVGIHDVEKGVFLCEKQSISNAASWYIGAVDVCEGLEKILCQKDGGMVGSMEGGHDKGCENTYW